MYVIYVIKFDSSCMAVVALTNNYEKDGGLERPEFYVVLLMFSNKYRYEKPLSLISVRFLFTRPRIYPEHITT